MKKSYQTTSVVQMSVLGTNGAGGVEGDVVLGGDGGGE